jgi:hypothetical protein
MDTKSKIIPKDLEECIKFLKEKILKEELEEIKNMTEDEFIGTYHHGFGTSLRNSWGLWQDSILVRYFNKMGIQHPDDMSGIIMKSFHRTLNKKPTKLREQVEYYKNYWKVKEQIYR